MVFPKDPRNNEVEAGLTLFVRPPTEVQVKDEPPEEDFGVRPPRGFSVCGSAKEVLQGRKEAVNKQLQMMSDQADECGCVGGWYYSSLSACKQICVTVFDVLEAAGVADASVQIHEDPDHSITVRVKNGERGLEFEVAPGGERMILYSLLDGQQVDYAKDPNPLKIQKEFDWLVAA